MWKEITRVPPLTHTFMCREYYLKLLTDIDKEHVDNIGALINFEKRALVSKIIKDIQGYQQHPYNLQPVHQIAQFFSHFESITDEQLNKMSASAESRQAAVQQTQMNLKASGLLS